MSAQINELRLQVERLDYDNKEGTITIDILKEQNQDGKNELEEMKKALAELKTSQKDSSVEEREKRKQEKMAMMMAKFDTVCHPLVIYFPCLTCNLVFSRVPFQRKMRHSVKFSLS